MVLVVFGSGECVCTCACVCACVYFSIQELDTIFSSKAPAASAAQGVSQTAEPQPARRVSQKAANQAKDGEGITSQSDQGAEAGEEKVCLFVCG